MFYLDLGWNIGISIIILFVLGFVILAHFAVSSAVKFKKSLRSAEKSIKMTSAETITLIRELCEIADLKITMEEDEIIEEVEGKIVEEKLFGIYKNVNSIYLNKYKEAISKDFNEEIIKKIEINYILQQEVDALYQKALFSYSSDLGGYNYWVKFWPTRFIMKLMKYNKKDELY